MTWEPVLHRISKFMGYPWAQIHFNRTTQATTRCRQEITGYIDDADKHVVTCIACIGALDG